MERRPRRVLAWIISGAAVLVIMAAAASGLFQFAVQAVPGYRDDVERYVRDVSGRPVRIGALGLTWHYYYPSLELIGVALLAEDGKTVVLQAERLRLGFGLMRLIRGDYVPTRLELHGLALDARIDRDGKVNIKGIDSDEGQDEPLDALRPLTRFDTVRLERCRLNLRDERRARGETYSFGVAYAELDRGLLADAVEAEVALPASIGDAAKFEGSFTGELLEPATWSGTGVLELSGLTAGSWLAPYLERGTRVATEGLEARLGGRIDRGRLAEVDVRLAAGATRLERARHVAAFETLEARVGVELLEDGWKARLRKFALETATGRWPDATGELKAVVAEGLPTAYEGQLSHARLADLAPWLRMLPVPAALAALDQGSGTVTDLQFRYQGGEDTRYHYRARFEDIALPAGERKAGFAGARGELAGDERGGRAVLQENPLKLELPGILATPEVTVEAFEGEAEWRRLDDGWRIGLPQFRWELLGTRGQGRFDLALPDGRSPEIDLEAQFSSDDATRAKPLMPLQWSTGLRAWLDRSIISGRAPKASLVIKGPLADFPYEERKTGTWSLDIEATGAELAYHPEWPSIEQITATLKFRGNGLAIEATHGVVLGNPIRGATAGFEDFRTALLRVDGTVAGETARSYEFLAKSPLRETFEGLLTQTTATGPSTVDIHLEIPVDDAEKTRVRGRVTLEGVELRQSSLPEPIREIRGQIAFDDQSGIDADRLTARLYELPLEARLVPQSARLTQLTAKFPFTVDAQGKGASSLVPAWIRKRVAGTSQWRAELLIGGEADPAVKLSTDLVGVEARLPPPIGKAADAATPLALTIGQGSDLPLRITAEYADRLGADLHFARVRDTMTLGRGTLRVGDGPLIEATEKGLMLGGSVAELDARAWATELQGGGIEQQLSTIHRADLHVGRAQWDRWIVRDARYQWSARNDGWLLSMIGAGAIGDATWKSAGQGELMVRMDQLALDYLAPEEDAAEPPPTDPSELPLFDLDVKRLSVNEAVLGHVALATARSSLGQRLRTLKIDGGGTTLTADGEWRRRAGQSSATLNGDLATGNIAALLKAFHYTPNLDAKVARFRGALSWPPSERGIEWQQAQGTVHLEFENGQLRAVEPGAGRVLGLVNFYALPRRLTLNFRDVLGSGLGFDKVSGDFELRDGNARTQNLNIDGPSLRMEMRGRIGLAARDYDQQVTVYPDVSAGVTLGAVLLGGPVAGALALIAQEVLNKPLNQVTQLSYRITGSWDNPQVERGATPGAPAAPGAAEAPAPPPAGKKP
jgi:uncharacterized protein (TIGR02099 family)